MSGIGASPLFSLEGRLALITGSGAGIGLALARGLAEHGAAIVAQRPHARQRLDEAVAALSRGGP